MGSHSSRSLSMLSTALRKNETRIAIECEESLKRGESRRPRRGKEASGTHAAQKRRGHTTEFAVFVTVRREPSGKKHRGHTPHRSAGDTPRTEAPGTHHAKKRRGHTTECAVFVTTRRELSGICNGRAGAVRWFRDPASPTCVLHRRARALAFGFNTAELMFGGRHLQNACYCVICGRHWKNACYNVGQTSKTLSLLGSWTS